jgi:hypothetical protein
MAAKDRVYKCLNPVGIQDPVELYPLAPRLDSIDGKTIMFSTRAGSEQDITIPLPKALQAAYPQVNWKVGETLHHGAISEEDLKSSDAVIRGVLW